MNIGFKGPRIGLTAAAVAIAATFGLAPGAHATPVTPTIDDTSQFNQANVDTTQFTPSVSAPYGEIDLENCTSAGGGSCLIVLKPSGNNIFFDTNALDLNLASGISFSSATDSNGTAITTKTSCNNCNNDGFGKFNTEIDLFDGPTDGINSSNTLTVTVTGSSLTSTSTFADVLALDDKSFDASGHVSNSASPTCTFKVGEGTGTNTPSNSNCQSASTTVPEPNTLAIFGTMLVALGGIGYAVRRRREGDL